MPAVVLKNKNPEETSRNKFQLTELQKEYLQLLLPSSMGLRLSDLTDEKRNRTPKKTEEIYDTEFFNEANRHGGNANSSHPKSEKKISTKEKEKAKDKTSKQKNIKISSEKRDEEKKKLEARRGRPCKENPIKKQILQKDLRNHDKVDSPKKKPKNHHQDNQFMDEEYVKKPVNHHRQQKPRTSDKQQKKMLSEKQERMEAKKKNKEKQLVKIEQSSPHQHNESHSFAPAQHKDDNSNSNEGLKNSGGRNRFATKFTPNEENSRRQSVMNMNSAPNMCENSQEHQPNDSRQLSPSSKQFCKRFLNKLKQHKASWPFRIPVDPVTQGVPNYLEIVHRPMDLRSIQKKLSSNEYQHVAEFHGDINKIFLNSYKFNPRETNYFILTVELEAFYYYLLENIEINPSFLDIQQPARTKNHKVEQDFTEQVPLKKKKTNYNAKKPGKLSKNMSMKEKDSSDVQKESPMDNQSKQRKVESDHLPESHREAKQEEILAPKPVQSEADAGKNLLEGIGTPKKIPRPQSSAQKNSHKKKINHQEPESTQKLFEGLPKQLKKSFSLQQKKSLVQRIRKLPSQYLQNVLVIIYGADYANLNNYENDFNIELSDLTEETLRKLESYVKEKQSMKADEPTCLEKYLISDERLYIFDPFPGTF